MPLFRKDEDIVRIIKGVRDAERLMSDELPVGGNAGSPSPTMVVVEVTGAKIEVNSPPYASPDGAVTEKGYYPGKCLYYNSDKTDEFLEFFSIEDGDNECLVRAIDDSELRVSGKYHGVVQSLRNMKPVVLVNSVQTPLVCSGCGWVNALTKDSCLMATLLSASGRCDCGADTAVGATIPLTSVDGLTWTDAGTDDPLGVIEICDVKYRSTFSKEGCDGPCYSLRPAVEPCNSLCPDGSPYQWRVIFSGAGGDKATLNGTWVLDRDPAEPCRWFESRDGWTVAYALVGPFTAGPELTATRNSDPSTTYAHRVATNEDGCCAPSLDGSWTNGGSGTTPVGTSLQLIGTCPPVYVLTRDCCGPDYAIFSIGTPAVCTADDADGGRPSVNVARIRVDWVRCADTDSAFRPEPTELRRTVRRGGSARYPIQVQGVNPGQGPSFFQMALDLGTATVSQFIATLISPQGVEFPIFTEPPGITVPQAQMTFQPTATAPQGPVQSYTQSSGTLVSQFQSQSNFGVPQFQGPNGTWILQVQNLGPVAVVNPVRFVQMGFGALPPLGGQFTIMGQIGSPTTPQTQVPGVSVVTPFAVTQSVYPTPSSVVTQSLPPGLGNNNQFTINTSNGQISTGLTTVQPTYTIVVRTTQVGFTDLFFDTPFTVTRVDQATDLGISNSVLLAATGTAVGAFSVAAPSSISGRPVTYSLVTGSGDTNNGLFTLTGPALSAASPLSAGSYSVRIRVTDPDFSILTYEEPFTVTAVPAVSAPTLSIPSSITVTEDVAYPITASVTPVTSGSVATVVISGVPPGVTFSTGTDTGSGTWSFTQAQFASMSITVPDDGPPFVLTVTATASLVPPSGNTANTVGTITVSVIAPVTGSANCSTAVEVALAAIYSVTLAAAIEFQWFYISGPAAGSYRITATGLGASTGIDLRNDGCVGGYSVAAPSSDGCHNFTHTGGDILIDVNQVFGTPGTVVTFKIESGSC